MSHCRGCPGRVCTTPTADLYLPGPKPPLTYEDCPGCTECSENGDKIAFLHEKVAQQVEELNTVIRQKWEIEGQLERCAKSVKALVSERAEKDAEIATLTTERDALLAVAEAAKAMLGEKIAVDGKKHAIWNHNNPSAWISHWIVLLDALAAWEATRAK